MKYPKALIYHLIVLNLGILLRHFPKYIPIVFFKIQFCPRRFFIYSKCFKCFLDGFFSFINQLSIISKHVYLWLYIRPFLFGKDMPTILGLRLMNVANSSACKMYSIGAIGHPRRIEREMVTKRDTNPFVWILAFAFLKSICTQPLKQSLKPIFSKHKSIHPQSALSNAFCWFRNINKPPLHLPYTV